MKRVNLMPCLLLMTAIAWLVIPAAMAQDTATTDAAAPASPTPPATISEADLAPAPVEPAAPAEAAAAEAAPAETAAPVEAAPETAMEAAAPAAEAEPADASMLELPTADESPAGIEVTDSGAADNKISITLDNVPLQDVVRMFTRISGANIVAGTNLQGSVTVNLQDVEWEPALQVILDSAGMALLEKSSGIFMIVSKNELAAEPVTSETLFLNYVTVSNMLPLVKSMIISTNGQASGFPGSNAIIVQETVNRIKSIRDVLAQIDRPREQVLIEAKFVELNDEAIKDIGLDWQVLQNYTVGVTPSAVYDRTKTTTDSSEDTDSDGTIRRITGRNTAQDTRIRRNVSQDAFINTAGETLSSGTIASLPSGTVSGSDSIGSSEQSFSVSGENFSDFDPESGKLTLIPRDDRTRTDDRFNEDETVRTLNTLAAGGSVVDDVTTKAFSAILSADEFALTLSALKQNNGVEIVSNPKVVVASGETATIHVGRNEPNIVAVPQGDTGDRYAYQLDDTTPFIEIGVKLNVTPTLNTESNISVRISPELSRKLTDKFVGEAGTSYPVTQIRKINTEFNLESGRTVAIGGLTETTDQENVKKIPILGDIPIIGKYLFRHTHMEKVQDEVIIFVTVTSAKPNALAQISGIPEEGKLIHRHLAKRAEDLAKAEREGERKDKKKSSVNRK